MAHVRSFIRCYMAGAGFNTRGMQNLGLMYAMQPGLDAIHASIRERKAAYKRYVRHYQSHPFWLPCLVGIYLNVESSIAQGRFPPKMLAKVKTTTAYTLSALGDSVFAGSMLIFWALLTICLILSGQIEAAVALGLTFFIGLQAFRIYTFVCGLRQGFRFLDRLKRWDLINLGRRVKFVNAALVLWLWIIIWPRPFLWWEWLIGVSALMLVGKYGKMGFFPRMLAAGLFVVAIENFPSIEQWIKTALTL